MKALEMNARGINEINVQKNSSQNLASTATFKYGRYFLIMKRPLTTSDLESDTQFFQGQSIPIAFNVWNGSAGETESQKVISSWFNLEIE